MTETKRYMLLKEMGVLFGTTSHQIGRKLKDLGLRTDDGKPSRAAFDRCLPGQKFHGDHFAWSWAVPDTIQILEEAGLKRVERPDADDE